MGFLNEKAGRISESPTILQRVAKGDRSAVKDCINCYGNFIWAMTRKGTNSLTDAEAVTLEIFLDIWRYAGRVRSINLNERIFITFIVRHRLKVFINRSKPKLSM